MVPCCTVGARDAKSISGNALVPIALHLRDPTNIFHHVARIILARSTPEVESFTQETGAFQFGNVLNAAAALVGTGNWTFERSGVNWLHTCTPYPGNCRITVTKHSRYD
jgi:hypothetical protein